MRLGFFWNTEPLTFLAKKILPGIFNGFKKSKVFSLFQNRKFLMVFGFLFTVIELVVVPLKNPFPKSFASRKRKI